MPTPPIVNSSDQASPPQLSVIVPMFNEADGIERFHQRMTHVLEQMPEVEAELIYVDDGSLDTSVKIVNDLSSTDERIRLIELSRNFGKEAAMTAGLDFSLGERVLIIDADLQDPPELLPKMWALADKGYDIVVPRRTARPGETQAKVFFSKAFYWVMEHIHAGVRLTPGTGDFRLMSRRTVDAIQQLREHNRFMKGIFEWVGYPRALLDYEREPRAAGSTKFNFLKLLHLASDGLAAFSTAPLRLATLTGVVTAFAAFLSGLFVVVKTLIYGDPVAGFPTLITVMLFFSGVQLLSIGVLGEYVGRIYNETKGRPLYIAKHRATKTPSSPN